MKQRRFEETSVEVFSIDDTGTELDAKEGRSFRGTAGGYLWCYTDDGLTPLHKVSDRKKRVEQLTLDGTLISTFSSVTEAADKTGIWHISGCCRGERPSAGGFRWRFA